MFINEVEHIVGISKKSIRYYEQMGLLMPKRNKENEYRIYTEEDIKKLKIIKFLRELNVPIREIKQLNDNELTLQECMKERLNKIENELNNYSRVKAMCTEILNSNENFETINITKYFQEINILKKEGFTMKEVKTNKKKKIQGAIFSSIIFSFFFLFILGIVTYFQFTDIDKMPWILYVFFVLIFIFPLFGIIINLIDRIKEINKGEEDEASKY